MSLGVPNCLIGASAATVPDKAIEDSSARKKESTWSLDADGRFQQEKGGATRNYTIDKEVGSGRQATIWTIVGNGEERGKAKIAKIADHLYFGNSFREYEVSTKYPYKSVGLMLKAKAYLDNGEDKKFLIMHKYDGDIRSIISTMTKKEKIEAICQLAKGLSTLHDLQIIHGDLGLQNIFYDSKKNRYDIADFGFSRGVKEKTEMLNSSINDDIKNFIKVVEFILIGEDLMKNCRKYKQELNTKEDVLRLGYSEEVSTLIVDFMNNAPDNMQKVCEIFDKVKKAFDDSQPLEI